MMMLGLSRSAGSVLGRLSKAVKAPITLGSAAHNAADCGFGLVGGIAALAVVGLEIGLARTLVGFVSGNTANPRPA